MTIRDFGFATYLFMVGYDYKVIDNKLFFKLSEENYSRELTNFKNSEHFLYDRYSKEIKKSLKNFK